MKIISQMDRGLEEETVEVHTDFNDFESATFSGDRADMNNYCVKQRKNHNIIAWSRSIGGSSYDDYKAWADANLEEKMQLLNSFEKNDPSDIFWSTQEANIEFKWAADLEKYPNLEGVEEIMALLHTADAMIDNSEIRDLVWVNFYK